MTHRDVRLRLRDEADLPDLLREALDTVKDDDLPDPERVDRIHGELTASIVRGREERAQALSPRTSGWRPSAPRRHIRFAAAKVGLAALVGMGAAWSGIEGYRVYREVTARAAVERPSPVSIVEPTRIGGRRATDPSTREAPGFDPTPSVATEPAPVLTAPPVVVRPDPSRVATSASPAARSEPPSPSPNFAQAPAAPFEEDLLERATQALRRDPAESLALADEHARAFAEGRLVQEREVIAIQALAKLARFDAARARAQRFLERYSNSPYANDVVRFANAR